MTGQEYLLFFGPDAEESILVHAGNIASVQVYGEQTEIRMVSGVNQIVPMPFSHFVKQLMALGITVHQII